MSEYSVTSEKLRPTGYEFPVGNITKSVASEPNSYFDSLGGTKTFSGDYVIHTFNSSGAFKDYSGSTGHDCEYLIIAGGGAGAHISGGGGGAGGFRYGTNLPVSVNLEYVVVIGSGGTATSAWNSGGSNGNDSEISNINLAPHTQANSTGHLFATGGGRGGSGAFQILSPHLRDGASGGCGAGGGGGRTDPDYFGVTNDGARGDTSSHPVGNPSTQGYRGGRGRGQPPSSNGGMPRSGGGGGGIGGEGADGSDSPWVGGAGGAGLEYSISGSPVYYAGGGGGGPGGLAGVVADRPAGNGGYNPGYAPEAYNGLAGAANRGGGGGGGYALNIPTYQSAGGATQTTALGGNGGDGVVIIRYAKTGLTGYEVN